MLMAGCALFSVGHRRAVTIWMVAVLLLTGYARSQTNTGTVSGSVVDPQSRVIAGADVVVSNTDLSSKRRAVTDSAGTFRVSRACSRYALYFC